MNSTKEKFKYSIKPYTGTENYIFASYCHTNNDEVGPIIEYLANKGFRIWWYEEGTPIGESWSAIVEEKIHSARVIIPFISPEYVESENCRKEIQFANEQKVFIVPVYLTKTTLKYGLGLLLAGNNSINKTEYADNDAFFERLCWDEKGAAKLLSCKNDAPPPVRTDNDSDTTIVFTHDTKKSVDPLMENPDYLFPPVKMGNDSDTTIVFTHTEKRHLNSPMYNPDYIFSLSDDWKDKQQNLTSESNVSKNEPTAFGSKTIFSEKEMPEKPEPIKESPEESCIEDSSFAERPESITEKVPSGWYLCRLKDKVKYRLFYGSFVIGRSQLHADYTVSENPSVGRTHALLDISRDSVNITDKKSQYGTFVNGTRLRPYDPTPLHDGDIISLSNEKFTLGRE